MGEGTPRPRGNCERPCCGHPVWRAHRFSSVTDRPGDPDQDLPSTISGTTQGPTAVGVAEFEPTTSSSRSNSGRRSTLGRCVAHLLRRSAGVHACPPVFVCVVTQLDTHPALRCELRAGRSSRLAEHVRSTGASSVRLPPLTIALGVRYIRGSHPQSGGYIVYWQLRRTADITTVDVSGDVSPPHERWTQPGTAALVIKAKQAPPTTPSQKPATIWRPATIREITIAITLSHTV